MNLLDKFSKIKVFVFDVDGVLTDGQLLIQEDGVLLRSMNIKDGYALQLAIKKGFHVWIISGAKDTGASKRLQKLGITELHFGVSDKLAVLADLIQKYAIDDVGTIAYMGDDMPDLEVMRNCGLKTCPADACVDVLQQVDYISPKNGGKGCVRDLIEKVLKIAQVWA